MRGRSQIDVIRLARVFVGRMINLVHVLCIFNHDSDESDSLNLLGERGGTLNYLNDPLALTNPNKTQIIG